MIIASLDLTDRLLRQWSVHAYGHDVADSWLLKDDTEANEVMSRIKVGMKKNLIGLTLTMDSL